MKKSKVQVLIIVVAVFVMLGMQQAHSQVRVITATETTGLPHDFTSLTDSVAGLLCTANEDVTACFATPYNVPSALVNPAFVVTGGFFGVNMFDPDGNLSDQLFLTVGPQTNGMNLLTWCWDSDLEPNINICPSGTVNITEPLFGRMDLTNFFAGPNGILAQGAWQVTALSESPEPSTFLLLGSGLLGLAGVMRRKLTL
jgi:hypothetical protein